MNNQFYRQSADGGESGPFSREELQAAAMMGELQAEDLVRSEGSSLWVSARRVKGLIGVDAPTRALSAAGGDTNRRNSGRPLTGTAGAAQAAYEAQLRALEFGDTDADSGYRSKNRRAAWWRGDVGWEVWLGVAVILATIVYTVWVPSEQLRFPPSQRGGNMAPAGYFFFGTGPWSTLEYGLLWFDAVLVVGALLFGRRLLGRSGG